MDIYLKPKTGSSNDWFRFPIMPDRISINTAASSLSLTVINLGEVRIPKGNQLTSYQWSGILPGEHMKDASFVFDWQQPAAIVQRLKEWQAQGTTLTLMVTELSINEDVFIQTLNYEYSGVGDCNYSISLSVRKELSITATVKPPLPNDSEVDKKKEPAKQNPSTQTGQVTGGSVYYRKGPGMSYHAYGTYHKGDKLQLISKSGNWWKFVCKKVDAGVAWMSGKYIKVIS